MALRLTSGLRMTVPNRFFLILFSSLGSCQHAWSFATYTRELFLYHSERLSSTSLLMGRKDPLTKLMTPESLVLQSIKTSECQRCQTEREQKSRAVRLFYVR